jgi:hypothetical protein
MLILTKSFAHPFQQTVTLGISLWVDLKKPDTNGMTPAEEEASMKKSERKGSLSPTQHMCHL